MTDLTLASLSPAQRSVFGPLLSSDESITQQAYRVLATRSPHEQRLFIDRMLRLGPQGPAPVVLPRLLESSEHVAWTAQALHSCREAVCAFDFSQFLHLAKLVSLYVPVEWVLMESQRKGTQHLLLAELGSEPFERSETLRVVEASSNSGSADAVVASSSSNSPAPNVLTDAAAAPTVTVLTEDNHPWTDVLLSYGASFVAIILSGLALHAATISQPHNHTQSEPTPITQPADLDVRSPNHRQSSTDRHRADSDPKSISVTPLRPSYSTSASSSSSRLQSVITQTVSKQDHLHHQPSTSTTAAGQSNIQPSPAWTRKIEILSADVVSQSDRLETLERTMQHMTTDTAELVRRDRMLEKQMRDMHTTVQSLAEKLESTASSMQAALSKVRTELAEKVSKELIPRVAATEREFNNSTLLAESSSSSNFAMPVHQASGRIQPKHPVLGTATGIPPASKQVAVNAVMPWTEAVRKGPTAIIRSRQVSNALGRMRTSWLDMSVVVEKLAGLILYIFRLIMGLPPS